MSALSAASSLSRNCSVSRSSCLDFALPSIHAAVPVARPALQRTRWRSRAVRVRAEMQQSKGVVAGLRSSCTKFLQRYDPVTTGLGSLLVTGYCVVAHDQSVGEALNIAAAATVLGMVMQEVLFNNDEAKNEA